MWELFFEHFLILWGLFLASLFAELRGPLFMALGDMLTPCFHIFAALVRTSGFRIILEISFAKTRFPKVPEHPF